MNIAVIASIVLALYNLIKGDFVGACLMLFLAWIVSGFKGGSR